MLLAVCGCAVIETGDELTSSSLLKTARPSRDTVQVDIYWVDLPSDGAERLWQSIEEIRLPADLRRRLSSNGLRAGVVGGSLPDELLALLNPNGVSEAPDPDAERAGVRSLEETGVSRASYSMTPGRRIDLQAGPLSEFETVLFSRDGKLTGKTFNRLQPTYTLQLSKRDRHDAVGGQLLLTPELRHGDQRLRFTPDNSGFINRSLLTQDVEPFPELAIATKLAAGEGLLITSTPDAEGRLGGCFHRDADEAKQRRAMLIRVAAAPREEAFDVDFSAEEN